MYPLGIRGSIKLFLILRIIRTLPVGVYPTWTWPLTWTPGSNCNTDVWTSEWSRCGSALHTIHMPPSDFHIDAQSILQAEKLTADLQKSHISTVEKDSREIIDSFRSEPKPGTAITQLSKPLDAIASEIPLRDIGIDVREFGVVAALAHTYDRPIFALPMGPENAAVPVP